MKFKAFYQKNNKKISFMMIILKFIIILNKINLN